MKINMNEIKPERDLQVFRWLEDSGFTHNVSVGNNGLLLEVDMSEEEEVYFKLRFVGK